MLCQEVRRAIDKSLKDMYTYYKTLTKDMRRTENLSHLATEDSDLNVSNAGGRGELFKEEYVNAI